MLEMTESKLTRLFPGDVRPLYAPKASRVFTRRLCSECGGVRKILPAQGSTSLCRSCFAKKASREWSNPFRVRDGLRLLFEDKINFGSRVVRRMGLKALGRSPSRKKFPERVALRLSKKQLKFLKTKGNMNEFLRELIDDEIVNGS